jgi:hypothetical protein
MPLPRYLTKPLRWLRASYPAGASPHGYVPLIALAPSPAAQPGSLLNAGELPARSAALSQQGGHTAVRNLSKAPAAPGFDTAARPADRSILT